MDPTEESFLSMGDRLVEYATDFGGLTPDADIFDIGSGYGRFAHALLRTRSYTGNYAGFDILERHVEWSRANLTPLANASMEFDHLDVLNGRYNPNGSTTAAELVLPFDGDSDLIVLFSVFTHMHFAGIRNYLSQFAQHLRPRGRVLATFFLLNDSWRTLEAQNASQYPLPHEETPFCRYMSSDDPLHVIAYDEEWVTNEVRAAGLKVREVILGSWCGRENRPTFQDIVVMEPAQNV